MSIENDVFNLLHSSGVLCVKQVTTCVISANMKIQLVNTKVNNPRNPRFRKLRGFNDKEVTIMEVNENVKSIQHTK